MKKVIGYLRVSTTSQNPTRQAELIKEYCEKNNYEYLEAKEISETGVSGTDTGREGLIRLMSLTKNDCDIVIISETSRLNRDDNYLSLANNVNLLTGIGIDVLFISNEKKLYGGKQLTFEQIISLIFEAKANSDERKKIVERCTTGRRSKVKQGCFVGHKVAYGFKVISNPLRIKDNREHGKSLYVIDNDKRATVELIFDLIGNQGYTMRGTINHLNDMGMFKDGLKWINSTMSGIIHNPLYMGVYSFSGESVNIEPIISKELYEKTLVQLHSNHLNTNKGNVHFNPLKGLLKCPCGGNMSINVRNNKVLYYNCTNKRNPDYDTTCSNLGIHVEHLNNIVWKFTKAFLNKDDFQLKTVEATKLLNKQIEFKEVKVNSLIVQYDTLSKGIESASNNLFDEPDKTIYQLLSSKLSLRIKEQIELKNSIDIANKEIIKLKAKLSNYNYSVDKELLKSITEEEKNVLYKKYINKITYYSVTKFKGIIHILFNNGIEYTALNKTNIEKEAFELPQNCTINPKNRRIIATFQSMKEMSLENGFNFPVKEIKEYYFADYEKAFNIDEFKMNLKD